MPALRATSVRQEPARIAEDVITDTSHFGIGYATAPEKPGLGIELDPVQLDRLAAE